MLVKVKTLSGKEVELDIESKDKVLKIKERIEEKEGIPPAQQRNDDKLASEYNVEGGSVLHLVLALRDMINVKLNSCGITLVVKRKVEMGRHSRPKHIREDAKKAKPERKERKEKDPDAPKKVPRTVENSRAPSDTAVQAHDPEIQISDAMDEFAAFFSGEEIPKILVTSSRRASKKTEAFCEEVSDIFPNCQYVKRPVSHLIKDVIRDALQMQFTHVIVVSENQKLPETMIMTKLPEGPTAYFHLTSIKAGKDIYMHGRSSAHSPELILNNFSTRLGHTIGRFFVSLFPKVPQFHGRQVVTFHNQRDFIFFRRHRYIFDDQGQRVTLQEIGPRFTLKLEALQKGTFNRQSGEFELSHKASDQAARKRSFIL